MEKSLFTHNKMNEIDFILEKESQILLNDFNYNIYEKRIAKIISDEELRVFKGYNKNDSIILELQQLNYFIRRYENTLIYDLGVKKGMQLGDSDA